MPTKDKENFDDIIKKAEHANGAELFILMEKIINMTALNPKERSDKALLILAKLIKESIQNKNKNIYEIIDKGRKFYNVLLPYLSEEAKLQFVQILSTA
ncbi:MAG: hypothetical protein ACP5TL_00490 [Candidatus Micrarchaeia archaeon]